MTNAISVKDRLKKQRAGCNYIKLVIGIVQKCMVLLLCKKRGRRDSDGWKKAKAYGSKEIGRQSG